MDGKQIKSSKKIKNSKDSDMNIISLPEEILILIFSYLTQNELGQIASVCRRFNECGRSPVLWRKVNVKLFSCYAPENETVPLFFKKLPSSVTHLKLDFPDCIWKESLNFKKLCSILKQNCPDLHALMWQRTLFSETLPGFIDVCCKFLPNLKVLLLPMCGFADDSKKIKYQGHPKIKILDVSRSENVERSIMCSFSKIPHLKRLNLYRISVTDDWFENEDMSFLHQLQVLYLGWTDISSRTFDILKNHAVNLTELILCYTDLNDNDLSFSNSAFPLLKTICLISCFNITCEGVVSLIQSCHSLQNVFVESDTAECYANHPFVTASVSKIGIVKGIFDCNHLEGENFLPDQ